MEETIRGTGFKRDVVFEPAYDNRRDGYGIHGAQIRFLLSGDEGVVQFLIFTDWHLPGVGQLGKYGERIAKPMAADLGYHSPDPKYEGQTKSECSLLDGGFCYYDGSGLNAEPVFETLIAEGGDGLWKALEKYYQQMFGGGHGQ
ncbi:MAG: hypothetical protein ACYCOR_10620 [Acidobacteriaceae bacterium]